MYDGKKVLVVGAARSGLAAARFLLSRGAVVVLSDSKEEEELSPALKELRSVPRAAHNLVLELGGNRPEACHGCNLVVASPGVPLNRPVFLESRRIGIPVIAEVELACRHLRGTILGVTGSNGKTTTTALVNEMMQGAGYRCRVAGNIGAALTGFVDGSTAEDFWAVELSSFQLEGILDFRPRIGAVLNVTPDHMDRYEGFGQYAAAKARIFMNQNANDIAVLNGDDPCTREMAVRIRSTAVLFSRKSEPGRGTFISAGIARSRRLGREDELFPVSEIRLRGTHNLENVLAAAAIAVEAGADPASLRRTVAGFTGVEHRLEFVAEADGIAWYNDSKATNVDAALKALEAFSEPIVLVAGGRDKGGDFPLLRPAVERRVRHLILIGEAAETIGRALGEAAHCERAESMEDAVRKARAAARPGDVVLLAPACASFDMFDNYEHRGRVFKSAVGRLARLATDSGEGF